MVQKSFSKPYSFHTQEHVIEELRVFTPFVGEDEYIISDDYIVKKIPEQEHRKRPWGPGNNPATAINEFLSETDRFEIDEKIDKCLLFSCHTGGCL